MSDFYQKEREKSKWIREGINREESIVEKIIDKELKLWQEAYPEHSLLLAKFSNKIKLEIKMKK